MIREPFSGVKAVPAIYKATQFKVNDDSRFIEDPNKSKFELLKASKERKEIKLSVQGVDVSIAGEKVKGAYISHQNSNNSKFLKLVIMLRN